MIEVWDFDPAETISEKMNKVFEIKGAKGFRKLMKEIALTASTGKHNNEYIGCTTIPLKTIPQSGNMMWYNLFKKGKSRNQGSIKVRLNFSSEKNDQVALKEHRNLLKIFLYYELESSQVAYHWWSGKFNSMAETIIKQHQYQSGISEINVALAKWSVFTEVHQQYPLSFELFEDVLEFLLRPIQQQNIICYEELTNFWESTKRFLPTCFGTVIKLRHKLCGQSDSLRNLTKSLSLISKIYSMNPPESLDFFPEQYYGWLKKKEGIVLNILDVLNQAVTTAAEEYFENIIDQDNLCNNDVELRLQKLIKVIQLARSDLHRAIEHHDKIFQK